MKTSFTVLVVGLDGSGKSVFVQSSKDEMFGVDREILPTAGFSIEKVSIPQISKPITVIDCSGLGRHRENWQVFYPDCDAAIFVIDATDNKRLSLLKKTVEEFLNDSFIKVVPVVFALNKQDREDIIDTEELKDLLDLNKVKKSRAKKIIVRETSGFKGLGVGETFNWLADNITPTASHH